MVASASSSNTQCPSGRCKPSSASVAASMLRSIVDAGIAGMRPTDMRFTCSRSRAANQISRPVAGPDCPFYRRRQPGHSPIAGEEKIAPRRCRGRSFGILTRGRRKGGTAFTHDLPRRERLGKGGEGRDLVPNFLRQRLAWNVEQTVGLIRGARSAVGKCKQRREDAGLDADDGNNSGGRLERKMRV